MHRFIIALIAVVSVAVCTRAETPTVLPLPQLEGETATIRHFGTSPLGGYLFAVAHGSTPHIVVWKAGETKPCSTIKANDLIGPSWSADDRHLAFLAQADDGYRIIVCDPALGKPIHSTPIGDDIYNLRHVAVAPGGIKTFLHIDGGKNYHSSVIMFDMAKRKRVRTIATHDAENGQAAMAVSPDGKVLATVGATSKADAVVCLWDIETGERLATSKPQAKPMRGVSFLTDGKKLATYAIDGTVRCWDISDPKALAVSSTIRCNPAVESDAKLRWDHGRLITDAAGKTVGVCSFEHSPGFIRIWDSTSGAQIVTALSDHMQHGACLAPDGSGYWTASSEPKPILRFWPIAEHAVSNIPAMTIAKLQRAPDGIAYSQDGRHLWLWEKYLRGIIRQDTLAEGKPLKWVYSDSEPDFRPWQLHSGSSLLNPLISQISRIDRETIPDNHGNYQMRLESIDLVSGNVKFKASEDKIQALLRPIPAADLRASTYAFRCAGGNRWLFAYTGDAGPWSITDDNLDRLVNGTGKLINSVGSSDGGIFAVSTLSNQRNLQIYKTDKPNNDEPDQLPLRGLGYDALLGISDDKRYVFGVGHSYGGYLWRGDLKNLEVDFLTPALDLRSQLKIRATAFHAATPAVAAALEDGTLRVWHGATGRQLVRLVAPGTAKALTFSPDGTTLVGVFVANEQDDYRKESVVKSWAIGPLLRGPQ